MTAEQDESFQEEHKNPFCTFCVLCVTPQLLLSDSCATKLQQLETVRVAHLLILLSVIVSSNVRLSIKNQHSQHFDAVGETVHLLGYEE